MSGPLNVPLFGPGSQPGDDDGASLDYMQMPSGMITFAAPDLPEPEDVENIGPALAALEQTLEFLRAYCADGAQSVVELGGLDAGNLAFVNQALGEGEVSAIGGDAAQAQESVLAGVWRVRLTDAKGAVVRDVIEIASFPSLLRDAAFEGAAPAVEIPDAFGPDVFNAPPLLPEINEHAPKAEPGAPAHVINLSLLPHTEADLAFLDKQLGRGRLIILSRGYGNCRIDATATRNVWWVRFYNSQDALILNSLEIVDIPEVALAAPEDIADSAERLDEILAIYRTEQEPETAAAGGSFFAGSYGGDSAKIAAGSRLECKICWHVYDPAEGCEYWQIPPGTAFADLPEHWTCPNCDGARKDFMVVK